MHQSNANPIISSILAAGALIASTISFAAAYLVPAIMISGINYTDANARTSHLQSHTRDVTALYALGWLLILAAAGLAVHATWSARLRPKTTA